MINILALAEGYPTLSTPGRFSVFPADAGILGGSLSRVAVCDASKIDASFLTMFTTRTRKTLAFNGLFLGLVVVVALVNGNRRVLAGKHQQFKTPAGRDGRQGFCFFTRPPSPQATQGAIPREEDSHETHRFPAHYRAPRAPRHHDDCRHPRRREPALIRRAARQLDSPCAWRATNRARDLSRRASRAPLGVPRCALAHRDPARPT